MKFAYDLTSMPWLLVALGCGLSVRFHMNDLDRVEQVLRTQKPTHLVGIYRVDRVGAGRPRLSPIAIYR